MPPFHDEAQIDRLIEKAIPDPSPFDRYDRECAALHAKYGDEIPKAERKALQSLYIDCYCENRDSHKGEELEYFLLSEREHSLDTIDRKRLAELHHKFFGLKGEDKPAVTSAPGFDGRRAA